MNTLIALIAFISMTIATDIHLSVPLRPVYHMNETTGVHYSFVVTTAFWKNSQWQAGESLPAAKLNKGDYVWWPTAKGKMEVLQIEHYAVNDLHSKCCWSITLGFPQCEVKYCCGSGCCC